MPALDNPRHELFAEALAEGKTAEEAYVGAGYKPSRAHASRLATNGNIQTRKAELLSRAAAKVDVSIQMVLQELAREPFSDVASAWMFSDLI